MAHNLSTLRANGYTYVLAYYVVMKSNLTRYRCLFIPWHVSVFDQCLTASLYSASVFRSKMARNLMCFHVSSSNGEEAWKNHLKETTHLASSVWEQRKVTEPRVAVITWCCRYASLLGRCVFLCFSDQPSGSWGLAKKYLYFCFSCQCFMRVYRNWGGASIFDSKCTIVCSRLRYFTANSDNTSVFMCLTI